MRGRAATALGWLAPTWLLLAWVYRGLLAGEVSFRRDTVLVFLPIKRWLAEGLAQGALAEWWPFDGLGQPMTSLPIASAFHPTTVLYALLPFVAAFAAQTLLPLVVMPVGVWLLARTLGLRPAGAGLAAGLVAVSFWSFFLSEQTQMHLAAASLPWFWREAVRLGSSRRGSPLVLALATANLVVGGDPMLLEVACLSLVVLIGRWPLRPRRLLEGGLALALGVALGGVQVVPMLHAFAESPRSLGLSLAPGDYWALRLREVPGLVLPVHHGADYLYDSIYVGVPTFVLAASALLVRWRYRWRLLGLIAFLGLAATGPAGGLWTLLGAAVPGWRGFQFPLKMIGPAMLPLALLAGRGLDHAVTRPWTWAVNALSGAVLAAVSGPLGLLQSLGGLLGWLASRRLAAAPLLLRAAVAALVLEVGLQIGVAPTWPLEQLLQPTPFAQALSRAGVSLVGGLYDWDYKVSLSMNARVPAWRDAQTELQLLSVAPSTGALVGLPVARPYLAGQTRRVFDVRQSPVWAERLAPVFGVVAHVGWYEGEGPPPRPNLAEDTDLAAVILPVAGARPRAYLAWEVREVPEPAQVAALEGLASPAAGGIVVAPGALPGPRERGRALQPVALVRESDALVVEFEASAAAILVVNEAWSAGWRAAIDGDPARVVPVNHAVMGVAVPGGRHRVRFDYETPGLTAGIATSAVAALLLLGWVLARRRRVAPTPS